MGDWKMSKPDLRAGLEADLKLVCDGRKTKEEVRIQRSYWILPKRV